MLSIVAYVSPVCSVLTRLSSAPTLVIGVTPYIPSAILVSALPSKFCEDTILVGTLAMPNALLFFICSWPVVLNAVAVTLTSTTLFSELTSPCKVPSALVLPTCVIIGLDAASIVSSPAVVIIVPAIFTN